MTIPQINESVNSSFPITPTEEHFFASKTMILVVITMVFIFLLVVVGIVVKIIWGVDAFNMVTSGIGGLVGQSAQGTYRNVQTDTPMRLAQQQSQTNTGGHL